MGLRTIAVAIGSVALLVFSVFLVLAAPLTERPLVSMALDDFAQTAPPTGVLYYLSHVVIHYMWLYFLIVVAIIITMAVGVNRRKIGDKVVWGYVAVTVLLNILAVASIHLVASRMDFFDQMQPAYRTQTHPATRPAEPV